MNVISDAERAAIDAVLGSATLGWGASARAATGGRFARGGVALKARRHLLLPALHAVQQAAGWITPEALDYLSQRLDVSPAESFGVATFYDLLDTVPGPDATLRICDDIACAGGAQLIAASRARYGDNVTVEPVSCLGHCARGSAAMVSVAGRQDVMVAPASSEGIDAAVGGGVTAGVADRIGGQLTLLSRVGLVDPSSLDDYRNHGGYAALGKAMRMGSAMVIGEIDLSLLRGRGGASFPTGRKWAAVARSEPIPKYVICNADESEPGTFKDRVILENDPFAIVEALTIAGFAVGASRGFIYVRGEYPLAVERVENAVSVAREAGLLGPSVMGTGFGFDIDVRRGAGAYICGEETALFNSIEGFRGEPRVKPPFPTDVGLFGKPTVINNVETLANVLPIVIEGGEAYAATGHGGSTGTKLFPVSGRVARPGLYEAPCCVSLGEIIELAGGAIGTFRAALVGGAAGVFMGPERLDDTMSFEHLAALGESYGSGAIVVFDETSDLDAVVRRIAAFFRHESCGQCVPCRIGTVAQQEALGHLLDGDGTWRKILADVDRVMTDASICGLGRTAASAIRSALHLGLIGGAS
ncbi:MAG: NADH-quinone oxidoreductase subunit E [Gammaproteobacteria bacterium]|nr:NADH-quinone oxidoreductase subunit E [Gammaproteobacteria bacterium]